MEGRIKRLIIPVSLIVAAISGCGHNETPMAPAVRQRDSLPVMTTYGVSKLISDSGIIKYKLVAEQWSVYDRTKPSKQTFMSGIFMQKYDPTFHVEMYLTADTAYWYDQNLWELRGRVEIRKKNGTKYHSGRIRNHGRKQGLKEADGDCSSSKFCNKILFKYLFSVTD